MKRIIYLTLIIVLAVGYFFREQGISIPGFSLWPQNAESRIQEAFNNRKSDLQIQDNGVVVKLLPDDLSGAKHQKFLVRLSTDQTVLIAHNIDLAPRINSLREGDSVEFCGEYEWNSKGGVVHWTHHDPNGRHADGWLKHDGEIYR